LKLFPRFLLLVVALLVCLVVGCAQNGLAMPVAERGVLDLTGWDPGRDGPASLDGQWEFYWDRLLTPEDFADEGVARTMSGYLAFPGYWKNYGLNGRPLPGAGVATFRLRILMPPGARQLTARFLAIRAACRVWADGTLVAERGVVGRSAEAEVPDRTLVLTKIASAGKPIDLVMQVSNHFFPGGGVQNSIMLAEPGELEQAHSNAWGWGLLFVGSMLIMAVYHFILYLLRRNDISPFYFGAYCITLTVLIASSDSSDWLIRSYFPDISFVTISRIVVISYACSTSLLYRFYRALYPKEFKLWLLYVIDVRGLIFVAIVLTQPGHVFQVALQLFSLTSLAFTTYIVFLLFLCFRRGHGGSLILLCGILALEISAMHDIYLLIFGTHVVSFLPLGLFALVLSQAFALARRFSNSFLAVESLSEKLEAKNVKLEEEIAERSRLEREIVNISEEERRRISLDLHDGLCQQLTGARLRCAALSRVSKETDGNSRELGQLSALLDELVDQAYDLSCGIWPLEHGPGGTGPSLEDMLRRYSRSSGIPVEFRDGRTCETCRNVQVTQLYRIAQEAITNAIKHAHAGRIVVSFVCAEDGTATLTVRDDGCGRSHGGKSKGGLGMSIMAHRAMMIGGTLRIVDIDDADGGGTMVVCSVDCRSGENKPGKEEEQ